MQHSHERLVMRTARPMTAIAPRLRRLLLPPRGVTACLELFILEIIDGTEISDLEAFRADEHTELRPALEIP